MSSLTRRCFLFPCLIAALASLAYGQLTQTGIHGFVKDPSSAVIPGADVKAMDMGTTITSALEKRKQVPDLSAVPADLRPIVQRSIHLIETEATKRGVMVRTELGDEPFLPDPFYLRPLDIGPLLDIGLLLAGPFGSGLVVRPIEPPPSFDAGFKSSSTAFAVLANQKLRGMAIYRTIFSSTVATSVAVASVT